MTDPPVENTVCDPTRISFIQKIYERISPIFRRRRFRIFADLIGPTPNDLILDVGGYPHTWTPYDRCAKRIDVLNIHPIPYEPCDSEQDIRMVVGNGCELEYADESYDIVFSNSVIEHLGTWENQIRFANEARRVGGKLWIQTPAREFFIEPHFIAPFIHWMPKSARKRLLRYFTVWGWLSKPTPEQVDSAIAEIRLLSYEEMLQLFPDCEIYRERFLFFFTKSYSAHRHGSRNAVVVDKVAESCEVDDQEKLVVR